MNKELGLRYFDELTTKLKLYQGVPKAIAGVGENVDVIDEYQLV